MTSSVKRPTDPLRCFGSCLSPDLVLGRTQLHTFSRQLGRLLVEIVRCRTRSLMLAQLANASDPCERRQPSAILHHAALESNPVVGIWLHCTSILSSVQGHPEVSSSENGWSVTPEATHTSCAVTVERGKHGREATECGIDLDGVLRHHNCSCRSFRCGSSVNYSHGVCWAAVLGSERFDVPSRFVIKELVAGSGSTCLGE